MQVTWLVRGSAVKGWQPRQNLGASRVSGLTASGPTFPSISVFEDGALEELAQNTHGSLVISLTPHRCVPSLGLLGRW